MLEWLKRHAWKACVPQKGIASSNLALSAKKNGTAVFSNCGAFMMSDRQKLAFVREGIIKAHQSRRDVPFYALLEPSRRKRDVASHKAWQISLLANGANGVAVNAIQICHLLGRSIEPDNGSLSIIGTAGSSVAAYGTKARSGRALA